MLITLQNYSLWLKFSILIPKVNLFMGKAWAKLIHAFLSSTSVEKYIYSTTKAGCLLPLAATI